VINSQCCLLRVGVLKKPGLEVMNKRMSRFQRLRGKLFQVAGQETQKLRGPFILVRIGDTIRSPWAAVFAVSCMVIGRICQDLVRKLCIWGTILWWSILLNLFASISSIKPQHAWYSHLAFSVWATVLDMHCYTWNQRYAMTIGQITFIQGASCRHKSNYKFILYRPTNAGACPL